jgi:hypothetical protein
MPLGRVLPIAAVIGGRAYFVVFKAVQARGFRSAEAMRVLEVWDGALPGAISSSSRMYCARSTDTEFGVQQCTLSLGHMPLRRA